LPPVAVSVKPGPFAVTKVGARELSTGTGLSAANEIDAEAPPPGVGLNTVTLDEPGDAISAEGTVVVSVVAFTKVVTRAVPFHSITEVLTKFVPLAVRVNDGPPGLTNVGLSEAKVGSGLSVVNVTVEDVPPPGAALETVIEFVPVAAISAAGTAAVICVALTYVVTSGVPFQFTTDPFTK
jgi:hypothetical protein